MSLSGGPSHPLHRRVAHSAGAGDVDELLGLAEVACAAVGQRELLLGNRPVFCLAEFLELPRRRRHDPRGVVVLTVLTQRGADPQPGTCPVPAAEPLVISKARVTPGGQLQLP